MYLIDIDTVIANLSGIPAITVPAGFSNDLPIGLQIMANELQEQTMLDAALIFESATNNIQRSPDL
jgi:aspartyl-tRNA(Asn)/glutamyl-tRNA(Gln) amidotransferase subunit A